MKKFLALFFIFLMLPGCAIASGTTVEDLEKTMQIDIDTASVARLTAFVEAIDKELAVYDAMIDKCLSRLEKLGASGWVRLYRGSPSVPANTDLSSMSLDELAALRDQINLLMMETDEWQEVTVPQGIYIVGKDIPAGHWTIRCAGTYFANIEVCDTIDSTGKDVNPYSYSSKYYWDEEVYNPTNMLYNQYNDLVECDIELREGLYVVIKYSSVIFTPYKGKPSLGFK